MKMLFEKICVFIIAALLIVSALSLSVSAVEYSGSCGDNVAYNFDMSTGLLEITGTGEMDSFIDSYVVSPPWSLYRCDIITVQISEGVTTIGEGAFCDCRNLETVIMPDSMTVIGSSTFSYCENLENIDIPDNVTEIGSCAFELCVNIRSVTIPASVITIGNMAFFNCDSLAEFKVDSNNRNYSSDSCGVLFNKDKTVLIQYPAGNPSENYTIPHSVTSIGDNALFSCDNLMSFDVAENNMNYSSDSNGVLFNKDKTVLVQYPIGNTRTGYTIPKSVSYIEESAFAACQTLTSITIPDSVTYIGWSAFEWCSELECINYTGNKSQWNGIYMEGHSENPFEDIKIQYNYTVAEAESDLADNNIKNEMNENNSNPENIGFVIVIVVLSFVIIALVAVIIVITLKKKSK